VEHAPNLFKSQQPSHRRFEWGDGVVLLAVGVLLYLGVRLALGAPRVVQGPAISLTPAALLAYAALSLGRMAAAYALSVLFTVVYGYLAAYNRRAEYVLLPLLDVLQSVPILSFLPVVLLSLSVILPQGVAAELASVVLIFTSQVWNMTFAWYQSLLTVPGDLKEASTVFRFNTWLRLRTVELPFAAVGLIWNSVMSWAGGWFFLMAAEMFTVGRRDFRLPGLGSYLQEAANRGDGRALAYGIGTLILIILALDQLLWRPLLAWAERFKLEMVGPEAPVRSWVYDALHASRLAGWLNRRVLRPWGGLLDAALLGWFSVDPGEAAPHGRRSWAWPLAGTLGGIGLLYGGVRAMQMLSAVPAAAWGAIGLGLGATLLRVALALALAMAWTIPVGVAIGTNPRLAAWLQPAVQVAASVPATALFPAFLLLVLQLPGGLSLAAVLLMLTGTQWYILFNVIAGAAAIPQDLKYTSDLLHLGGFDRWRTLVLPALFPFIITGAITAGGGAWNASIVAEYVSFGGQTVHTVGIGALIADATATGQYPRLLAATASMVLTVVLINRGIWRRLYRRAQDRFRLE